MRRHRRYRGTAGGLAASVAPATVPAPPLDVKTEAELTIEARDNLEAATSTFAARRSQEQTALLQSLGKELSVGPIDLNVILTKYAAWDTHEARLDQQLEALKQLQTMFRKRAERLKTDSPAEALSALQRIIERITSIRNQPGADVDALARRIEKLSVEAKALQYPQALPARKRQARSKSQRPEADENQR